MLTDIFASFFTVSHVDPHGYASGKNWAKEGENPLRRVVSDNVNCCQFWEVEAQKRFCEPHTLYIVLPEVDGIPTAILFHWKSRLVGVLREAIFPLLCYSGWVQCSGSLISDLYW